MERKKSALEKPTILVVDDEHLIRWSLVKALDGAGYQTEASFRKAFKDTTGEGPGAVRKKN